MIATPHPAVGSMNHTTRPELVGDFGMVASTHWLASSVGMSILERGGNAADAACAAGFVLQVVEPHLNGPGGEVPILFWDDSAQRVQAISGQGPAPQAADQETFRQLGLGVMPGTGLLPAVVPGAFSAWMQLLKDQGSLSVRDVLEPAIHYAASGHPVLARVSAAVKTVSPMFREHWPTSAQTWLPGGSAPEPNERFVNPVLAETYRRILAEAEAAGSSREQQIDGALEAWYCGFVAEAIGDYCASAEVMDTSGRHHRGLLTAADLSDFTAEFERPLSYDYLDYTVCKTGPWGQGPVMLQHLALLSGFDLDSVEPGSADWVHTIVETGKLAFADREAWYGDPAFQEVPMDGLLSAEYTGRRQRLVQQTASMELRPGSPGGRSWRLPAYPDPGDYGVEAPGMGEPTVAPSGETRGDTCHLDVVDREGNMISATPSGGWFQASPTVPGLGFCLSTRGQMFWLEEGLPNSLRPGARPRTTLTPSFALRGGRPWMAFGTPGGDFQDQWSLQMFLNVVHGRMNLQEAIDAPAFHSDHIPSSFYPHEAYPGQISIEDRFAPEVLAELVRRGHRLKVGEGWTEGRMSAVARDGGWFKAAANPRGSQGYAVGR